MRRCATQRKNKDKHKLWCLVTSVICCLQGHGLHACHMHGDTSIRASPVLLTHSCSSAAAGSYCLEQAAPLCHTTDHTPCTRPGACVIPRGSQILYLTVLSAQVLMHMSLEAS